MDKYEFNPKFPNSPRGLEGDLLDSGKKWDLFERYYFDPRGEKKLEVRNFRNFVDCLTGRERWLDLGAGLQSSLVRFMLEHGKLQRERLVSLDLDPVNLEFLKQVDENAAVILADASEIPLATGSVDRLVFDMTMADNPETKGKRERIFSEMFRVLKKGGIVQVDIFCDLPDEMFKLVFKLPTLGKFYRKK